jgi:uncharacterized membrane protein
MMEITNIELSFRGASQRVRPLAGPMTGSASEPGMTKIELRQEPFLHEVFLS